MTDEDWTAIVRWLTNHGFRVVVIDTVKRQIVLQLPGDASHHTP